MAARREGAAVKRLNRGPSILASYAELARISNLPTCISNVLVGCAIGAAAGRSTVDWGTIVGICVAISLFYVAGMVMNGAVDVEVDRVERPQRPIPSGRISLAAAHGLTVIGLAGGLVVVLPFGTPAFGLALALVAAIVTYNLLHKKVAASIVLMGACRGLVYLVAAAAMTWPFDGQPAAWLSASLAVYTIAITYVAQAETGQRIGNRRRAAVVMPLLVLLPTWAIRPEMWFSTLLAGVALVAWLGLATRFVFKRPPRTIPAVLTWLSGMCLVDAYFLTLLGHPRLALIAAACFVITAWAHRHILGT